MSNDNRTKQIVLRTIAYKFITTKAYIFLYVSKVYKYFRPNCKISKTSPGRSFILLALLQVLSVKEMNNAGSFVTFHQHILLIGFREWSSSHISPLSSRLLQFQPRWRNDFMSRYFTTPSSPKNIFAGVQQKPRSKKYSPSQNNIFFAYKNKY